MMKVYAKAFRNKALWSSKSEMRLEPKGNMNKMAKLNVKFLTHTYKFKTKDKHKGAIKAS